MCSCGFVFCVDNDLRVRVKGKQDDWPFGCVSFLTDSTLKLSHSLWIFHYVFPSRAQFLCILNVLLVSLPLAPWFRFCWKKGTCGWLTRVCGHRPSHGAHLHHRLCVLREPVGLWTDSCPAWFPTELQWRKGHKKKKKIERNTFFFSLEQQTLITTLVKISKFPNWMP